jgi:hypothetical protein
MNEQHGSTNDDPDLLIILREVVRTSDETIQTCDPEQVHDQIGRNVVSLLPVMRAAIARSEGKANRR